MSLDGWKSWLDWAAIVFTGCTVVSGGFALYLGNRLNAVKEAQLRAFDTDITDAKDKLAQQQTRAADAERQLIELQERIKPRRLSAEQRTAFVRALKEMPNGTVRIGHTSGSADEGILLAQQILPLFKEAGWVAPGPSGMTQRLDIQVTGIGVLIRQAPNLHIPAGQVRLTPVLLALQKAFRGAGMEIQFIDYHPENDDIPEVIVGSKPEPVLSPPPKS